MAFVKIYVYTSFVFWEIVGINRAVTGNALIEMVFFKVAFPWFCQLNLKANWEMPEKEFLF